MGALTVTKSTSSIFKGLLAGALLYTVTNIACATPVNVTVSGNLNATPMGLSGTSYSASFTYDPQSTAFTNISGFQLSGFTAPYLPPPTQLSTEDVLLYQGFSSTNYFYTVALYWTKSNLKNDEVIVDAENMSATNPQDTITVYEDLTPNYNIPIVPTAVNNVPAPPAWLMMLTGLGILVPLYRKHVKAQRKGGDGGNGLAI